MGNQHITLTHGHFGQSREVVEHTTTVRSSGQHEAGESTRCAGALAVGHEDVSISERKRESEGAQEEGNNRLGNKRTRVEGR